MGTAWKHWLFQSHRPPEISYFPVSDHLRTHQGQSPQSLDTPRTAGRCNRAGGGLPTSVLYPSTKIERPKGPQTRLPGGVLPLELDALDDRDSRVMTVPDSHRPTHGPTPPKFPFQGQLPRFRSETGTQGAHGRDSGFLLSVRLVLEYAGCSRRKWVRATPANAPGSRLRQARCSACPTRGWVNCFTQYTFRQGSFGVVMRVDSSPLSSEAISLFYLAQILRWVSA